MDGEDVFSLFDQNVPYELRLRDAIINGLVVPFKYYGIRDELIEYGNCQEMPFVLYRNEYGANCESACSLLIQEGSITPEEAVEQIRANAEYLKN